MAATPDPTLAETIRDSKVLSPKFISNHAWLEERKNFLTDPNSRPRWDDSSLVINYAKILKEQIGLVENEKCMLSNMHYYVLTNKTLIKLKVL